MRCARYASPNPYPSNFQPSQRSSFCDCRRLRFSGVADTTGLCATNEAAREARAFSDPKADPTANVYALAFLSQHPEVTAESVPWHVHRESATEGAEAGAEASPGSAFGRGMAEAPKRGLHPAAHVPPGPDLRALSSLVSVVIDLQLVLRPAQRRFRGRIRRERWKFLSARYIK
jgi:hypothetical protein